MVLNQALYRGMMEITAQNLVSCMSWQKICKAFEVRTNFKTSLLNWKLVIQIREEVMVIAAGHKVFLSGGSCCRNGGGSCWKFLNLHSSNYFTGYVACISRTATTTSKHFHVTCQLPGSTTMQLNMYMVYCGCCLSILIMQEECEILEQI